MSLKAGSFIFVIFSRGKHAVAMGTASSKFCKYIKHGDEAAAVHLLNSSSELRRALDPNATYKGIHNCDTPLHCVSRHGLTSLVRYNA
jgi:hypothetical protein